MTKSQSTTNQAKSRRAVVRTPSGPDSIETLEVALAAPGPAQIRVRVAAAAINPVDLGVARGVFQGELPARVHAAVPLDEAATACQEMAKGGVRGRIVLVPWP